jgi:uncharacterized small protein (DUF1192 family)
MALSQNYQPVSPPATGNAPLELYIIQELQRIANLLAELNERITALEP